jgi:hypothetical protein
MREKACTGGAQRTVAAEVIDIDGLAVYNGMRDS